MQVNFADRNREKITTGCGNFLLPGRGNGAPWHGLDHHRTEHSVVDPHTVVHGANSSRFRCCLPHPRTGTVPGLRQCVLQLWQHGTLLTKMRNPHCQSQQICLSSHAGRFQDHSKFPLGGLHRNLPACDDKHTCWD